MCGGTGSILGAALGYALAPVTGGASLALAYTAGGAAAGDLLVDRPQKKMQEAMQQQQVVTDTALDTAKKTVDDANNTNTKIVNDFTDANNKLVTDLKTELDSKNKIIADLNSTLKDNSSAMSSLSNTLGGVNLSSPQGVQALMRAPDFAAMLYRNQKREKGEGGSSTMLTGPQGVDVSALNLGKNTLLGG